MPRQSRFLISGEQGCYHAITRGNQKQDVFRKEGDQKRYFEIVRHYKKRYRFCLYAFCLMPNHIHLIIEPNVQYGSISKIMQGINLAYCIWFNKTYDKTGHLWQGRFKSPVLHKDEYLLRCINYVELNPVRAGIAQNPLDYIWSSYRYRTLNLKNDLLDDLSRIGATMP